MSVRWIMGLSFVFVLTHMACWIIEGVYEANNAADTINELGGFNILETGGLFGVPILSMTFFRALPEILSFDYPFLTGGFTAIRLLLICISLGVIWGVVQVFMPAIQGGLSRLLRL